MLINNLKLSLRRMKNNKVFTILNISGFALGFAVCMILALFVYQELTVDRGYANYQNIYRLIDIGRNNTRMDYYISGKLKEQFPEIQYATPVNYYSEESITLTRKSDGEYIQINEMIATTNDFFNLFSISPIVSKSINPFSDLNSLIISKSAALKLFGKTEVLDEMVSIGNFIELPICAVVEDIPENSSFGADIYFNAENENFRFSESCNNGVCFNPLEQYVYLNENTNLQNLIRNINTKFPENKSETDSVKFQKVSDIYLTTDIGGNRNKAGSKGLLYIFLSIALVILLMSAINYVNFSLSNQLSTLKELGIKLTNGAGKKYLGMYYLTEISLSVLVSFVIAVCITSLTLPFANNLLMTTLKLEWLFLPSLAFLFAGILIVIILISSLAPLYIIARFDVQRLFGKKELHLGKQYGKKALTIFQIAASIILLVSLVSIQKQLSFVKTTNLGFSKEFLLKVNIPEQNFDNYQALKQQFVNLSFVQACSFSSGGPGFIHHRMSANPKEGENIDFDCIYVDKDFLQTFGIPLDKGRDFLNSENGTSCIINQTAFKRYEWESFEGEKFNNGRKGGFNIVGVTSDFHISSFHDKITPVCLLYADNYSVLNVKLIPGNLADQMNQLQETWEAFFPDATFSYQFYDAYFDSLYKKEDRQGKAIALFSVIALIITCLGLLGQIVQMCITRVKEIGVRKVNGARTRELIALLNLDFVKWVVIAFIFASPVAYFVVNKWLENFVYKTVLSWWVLLLAGITVLVIDLATVTFISWRTANRNPIEALRYE